MLGPTNFPNRDKNKKGHRFGTKAYTLKHFPAALQLLKKAPLGTCPTRNRNFLCGLFVFRNFSGRMLSTTEIVLCSREPNHRYAGEPMHKLNCLAAIPLVLVFSPLAHPSES